MGQRDHVIGRAHEGARRVVAGQRDRAPRAPAGRCRAGRLGRRSIVTRKVGQRGAGLGIDVRRIGRVARHPSMRQRLEVAPPGCELVGEDASISAMAAVRAPVRRERASRGKAERARRRRDGERGHGLGQGRSGRIFRVAERTRLKLYSGIRLTLTWRARLTKEQARGQRYPDDHRQPHRQEPTRCPISDETIRATDLRQIKVAERRLRADDVRPGVHEHRGLPERHHLHRRRQGHPALSRAIRSSSWPSGPRSWRWRTCCARASCPTEAQLETWDETIKFHTYVHTNITKFLEGFRYDAHPMGMLLGVVGALSTFYPDAKNIHDPANRYLQRVRLLAKAPTIAAFAFRHSRGLPFVFPDNDLDYIGNFVNMTFSIGGRHQAEQGAAARARDPAHPARRPRAELLHQRGARGRLLPRGPVLRHQRRASPRCTARSTAAPTRPCSRCSTRSARRRTSRASSRR